MAAAPKILRLTYSRGWVLISAFAAAMTFLAALMEVGVLHPLLFSSPYSAMTLWAGLLMLVPLWFLSHRAVLLVLWLVLRPLGVPGKFEMSEAGVTLRLGKEETHLPWSEVRAIHSADAATDFSAASGVDAEGRALAQLAAAGAAKEWRLTFVSTDETTVTVTSQGFRRPLRRAEPQLRAWLRTHRDVEFGPFAKPQSTRQG